VVGVDLREHIDESLAAGDVNLVSRRVIEDVVTVAMEFEIRDLVP
jgi:hypothetical protein